MFEKENASFGSQSPLPLVDIWFVGCFVVLSSNNWDDDILTAIIMQIN
jgi:hypothetical protein